jgi:FtsH ternary system domain X6
MQTVSRFEANLLRLLYYFLRREPIERALPLVENRCQAPGCLSKKAVRLVQDALAKGCTFELAGRGGWMRERYLRGEQPVEGRLWKRSSPAELSLSFSAHTLEFLVWITAARPGDKEPRWEPAEADLTPADRLLLFFAHEGLRDSGDGLGAPELRKRPPFVHHGLCWLAYPEDFNHAPPEAAPNFAVWTTGLGACILEALQHDLAQRWIQIEGNKERIAAPQNMRALGQAQEKALVGFLDAVEKAGRLDLARFLLRAATVIVNPYAHAGMWTGALHTTGMRLADRTAAYESAMVFLHQMPRFQRWAHRARATGFFDEGYQAAQLYLADWEQYQVANLCERAQNIVRQMDPLRQG